MGIDHGQARIGVAISDPMRLFARPHRIIMHSNREADLAEIECIIDTEQVSKVVIGLPTDSEGGVGSQARIAIRWAKALSQTIAVPIVFWDESYSSQSAAALRPRGSKRAGRHSGKGQPADDLAAAIMLQDYLEAGGAENEPGWPLESLSHYD
jgi:putative Holliday junction resolvase